MANMLQNTTKTVPLKKIIVYKPYLARGLVRLWKYKVINETLVTKFSRRR